MPDTIASSKKPFGLALAGIAAAVAALTVSLGNPPGAAAAPAARQNIIGTAAATGQFKTLLSLAKQAGLVGALSGPGPLTVFAPTDAAFKAVPKATLRQLASNPKALRRVLLYHVVKGDVTAARVVKLKSTKTLAGPKISIQVRGGSVFLNGSTKVVKTDVLASNGTIHVINKVLLPPTSQRHSTRGERQPPTPPLASASSSSIKTRRQRSDSVEKLARNVVMSPGLAADRPAHDNDSAARPEPFGQRKGSA